MNITHTHTYIHILSHIGVISMLSLPRSYYHSVASFCFLSPMTHGSPSRVQPRQNLRLRENIASQCRRRSFHGSSRSPMGNPFGVGFLRFFYHRFLVKLGMVYIYMVHYWICYIVRSKKRLKIRFGRMTFAMLGFTCFFLGCMLK